MLISGTHKNRYTAFYTRPPTCPVPPFYSLEDSNGKVVATWSVRTRCYNLDVYNVCEDCRFLLTGTDPNEEHDCIHSGNFIPSTRKKVERQKYRAKKKKVSLRDAVALAQGSQKRQREFTPKNSNAKPRHETEAASSGECPAGELEKMALDIEVNDLLSQQGDSTDINQE